MSKSQCHLCHLQHQADQPYNHQLTSTMYMSRSQTNPNVRQTNANECGTGNLSETRELLSVSLTKAVVRAAVKLTAPAAQKTALVRDTDSNSRKFSVPLFA